MNTRDMSELSEEELENLDMESNLENSEYSDGDIMEPVEEDYSGADFDSGMIDEDMDAAIDGDYSEDFTDDGMMEDDMMEDDGEADFTDEDIEEPGQYGSDDTEAAG